MAEHDDRLPAISRTQKTRRLIAGAPRALSPAPRRSRDCQGIRAGRRLDGLPGSYARARDRRALSFGRFRRDTRSCSSAWRRRRDRLMILVVGSEHRWVASHETGGTPIGLPLRTDLNAKLPRLRGDRVQLQQVLLNLVTNAIQAMAGVSDRPRVLTIRSQLHERDDVPVEVEDSGIGLDPTSIDQIFANMFTTKPDGMGMGLSISRSIVAAHGGRIWASPRDYFGAIFRIALPTKFIPGPSSAVPSEISGNGIVGPASGQPAGR